MTRPTIDAAAVGAAIRSVAADVLARYADRSTWDVTEKAPDDLVTAVDRAIEADLAVVLGSFVDGTVVGEEACAADPSLIEALSGPQAWVVDPIDGTSNFAAGSSRFGVMVALVEDGSTSHSWIVHPVTGDAFWAIRESGAFCNGAALAAPPVQRPSASTLRGAVRTRFLPPKLRAHFESDAPPSVGSISSSWGSAAHDYPAIARGEQDFALFWRTLPWDHAPGVLLVLEAGGQALRLDGGAYSPTDDRTGLLVTAPGLDWAAVRSTLMP